MALPQTIEQRRQTLYHEYQIHEEHRCMLRVMAKHLNALQSPAKPDITEETVLQDMMDDLTEPPPPHVGT